MRSIKQYGWLPDLPDHRDFKFTPPKMSKIPQKIDLRSACPPVYNQGSLGSCTGNAIAGAIHILEFHKANIYQPSRLFIYYNERAMEGTIKTDSGAMIRDGIKSVAKQGVCDEKLWPYSVKKFAQKPSMAAYSAALKNKIGSYERIEQTDIAMKSSLALGFPFVFGFTVYESFEDNDVTFSGKVPMPKKGESVLGGHAVIAVGYDDMQERFICRNSWGANWGMKGYFTIPYAYLTNRGLASDFWVIKAL